MGQSEAQEYHGLQTLTAAGGYGWADSVGSLNPDEYAQPGTLRFLALPLPVRGTVILVR